MALKLRAKHSCVCSIRSETQAGGGQHRVKSLTGKGRSSHRGSLQVLDTFPVTRG